MAGFQRRQILALAGIGLWGGTLARVFRASAAAIAGTVVAVVGGLKSRPPEEPAPVPGGSGEAKPVAPPKPVFTPIAVGAAIGAGDTVATDGKSAADVQLPDGTMLTLGARSSAALGTTTAVAYLERGNFHVRSGAAGQDVSFKTALLTISFKTADFVVKVRDNASVLCGVTSGSITCTSNKKGTTQAVAAGQSVAWIDGSFGKGVTQGVFRTEDIAVDQGIEAARTAWTPPPPPTPQPKPAEPKPK